VVIGQTPGIDSDWRRGRPSTTSYGRSVLGWPMQAPRDLFGAVIGTDAGVPSNLAALSNNIATALALYNVAITFAPSPRRYVHHNPGSAPGSPEGDGTQQLGSPPVFLQRHDLEQLTTEAGPGGELGVRAPTRIQCFHPPFHFFGRFPRIRGMRCIQALTKSHKQ